ncbi:MAG: alpha/beta hydrolase [Promethearchaeota archaeon]|nr:MAG: alpha/beta hydrolase [Candidatus Lokiarchaeota archaeon]
MKESYAILDDIKLCYQEFGKGHPIILIHGIGGKKETWIAQIEELKKDFHLIIFDLRGVGKSDRPNVPYTMQMLANDVKGLMDFLKLTSAHIIGRSLGGMIAQYFALLYPQYVDKLVLMTTNPQVPDDQAAKLIKQGRIEEIRHLKENPEKTFWKNARILFHKDFRKALKQNPEKTFYDSFSAQDLIEETIKNPSTPIDIENLSNTLRSHNIIDKIHKITKETLLISGSHDRLTPKSSMMEIHKRIPNSRIEVIKKSGHFLHLSRAPKVNKLLIEFLK